MQKYLEDNDDYLTRSNSVDTNKPILTRKEAAALLTVSLPTFDGLVARGEIHYIQISRGRTIFLRDEILNDVRKLGGIQ